MVKAEMGIFGRYFAPGVKAGVTGDAGVDIVHQDNAALAHFWQPGFEIMKHGLFGVVAVNVQEVYAAVIKNPRGLVKGCSHQVGAAGVVFMHVGCNVVENFLTVKSCLFVAFPGVHGVAEAVAGVLQGLLAEGA